MNQKQLAKKIADARKRSRIRKDDYSIFELYLLDEDDEGSLEYVIEISYDDEFPDFPNYHAPIFEVRRDEKNNIIHPCEFYGVFCDSDTARGVARRIINELDPFKNHQLTIKEIK